MSPCNIIFTSTYNQRKGAIDTHIFPPQPLQCTYQSGASSLSVIIDAESSHSGWHWPLIAACNGLRVTKAQHRRTDVCNTLLYSPWPALRMQANTDRCPHRSPKEPICFRIRRTCNVLPVRVTC